MWESLVNLSPLEGEDRRFESDHPDQILFKINDLRVISFVRKTNILSPYPMGNSQWLEGTVLNTCSFK